MIWIGLHFTHIACKILFEMSSTHIPTNNSRNQPPTPPPPQNKKHSRTRFVSLTHTHVGGGRARREEVHAWCTYSRLFPNHTRAGTRWSSFLYEKGSPRGNLARVLVVHLVEGGSSTTGEQTNCDLTCYVKKRGKPCGAYLRGKALYTGVLLMCPVNSQNKEKLA